jgi:integrase
VRITLSTKLYDRKDAEREMLRLEDAYDSGQFDPWRHVERGRIMRGPLSASPVADDTVGGSTLSEEAEAYIAEKKERHEKGLRYGWAPSTQKQAVPVLRAFVEAMGGDRSVATLDAQKAEEWIFRPELRPATRASYRRIVAPFLARIEGDLRRNGYVEEGALEVGLPARKQKTIPEHLTETELERVCRLYEERETARQPAKWYGDAFRFAFYQGLRLGEIASLTRARVAFAPDDAEVPGTLRIGDASFRTKGGDEHFVELTPPAATVLRRRSEDISEEEDALFFPRTPRKISEAFRNAVRLAYPGDGGAKTSRPDLHFHSLRHSCAIYWLKAGWDIYRVSRLLTHSSVTMTERYLRALRSEDRRKFEEAKRGTIFRP